MVRRSKVLTIAISAALIGTLGFGVTEVVAPTAVSAGTGGIGCC